jgi:hypothetical protein
MDKVVIKAEIIGAGEDTGDLVLRVDDRYLPLLQRFVKEKLIAQPFRVSFQAWEDFSERAFKYFHFLRDELCKAAGDTTRAYKAHMKKCLKEDCAEQIDATMSGKSLADFTKTQLMKLIDFTLDRCAAEDMDMEALMPAFRELRDEYEEEK